MKKVIIKLENYSRSFGSNKVMSNINLEIYEGEFFTLLGSSGCGKTTILRSISGLDTPTTGKIYIDGEDVTNLEPQKRQVNTIFQNYALFPLMNIYDNVAFGLRMKHVPENEIKKRVKEMLELVHLEGYEDRLPKDLSGGEQQRVSIIRGLINNPKVLLLDEPLSALDLKLRKSMQLDLKRLQKKLGTTFVYVTHDQDEALTMSDRICLLRDDCIEQIGTPKEIYENPNNSYVADFLGEANFFDAVINDSKVNIENFKFDIKEKYKDNTSVKVIVRPENIRISKGKRENAIISKITEIIYDGATTKIITKTDKNTKIKILVLGNDSIFNVGDIAYLFWKIDDAIILENEKK